MSHLKNNLKKALCVAVAICFFSANISYADALRPPMGGARRAAQAAHQISSARNPDTGSMAKQGGRISIDPVLSILLPFALIVSYVASRPDSAFNRAYYNTQPAIVSTSPSLPATPATKPVAPSIQTPPAKPKPMTPKYSVLPESLARIVYKKVSELAKKDDVQIDQSLLFSPGYWERESFLDKETAKRAAEFFRKHSNKIFEKSIAADVTYDSKILKRIADSIATEGQIYVDRRIAKVSSSPMESCHETNKCYLIGETQVKTTYGGTQRVTITEPAKFTDEVGPGYGKPLPTIYFSRMISWIDEYIISALKGNNRIPMLPEEHGKEIDKIRIGFANMFRKLYQGMTREQIHARIALSIAIHEAQHALQNRHYSKALEEEIRTRGIVMKHWSMLREIDAYTIDLSNLVQFAFENVRYTNEDSRIFWILFSYVCKKDLLVYSRSEQLSIFGDYLIKLSRKDANEIREEIDAGARRFREKYKFPEPLVKISSLNPTSLRSKAVLSGFLENPDMSSLEKMAILEVSLAQARSDLADMENAARGKRGPWTVSPTQVAQARAAVKVAEKALEEAVLMARKEAEAGQVAVARAREAKARRIVDLLSLVARAGRDSL